MQTITGAELQQKAAKATRSDCNSSCASYVTIAVNDPRLKLNNTNQKFIPGNETLKRCTEALTAIGLESTDVLHIFGTASQTNGCESTNTNHATLDKQILDPTQGPTQNFESLSGTIKREIMYEDGELKDFDTAIPLINKLAELRVIECVDDPKSLDKHIGRWVPTDNYYNSEVTIWGQELLKSTSPTKFPRGKYAFYSNGYIQPDTLNEAGELKLMEAMASAPCSYMSQDNKSNDGEQEFTQNFAAAFSYQNSSAREFDDQGNPIFTSQQIIMNLMWIYPQYDNIIKDAIIKSANNSKKKIVMVHMPGIGQGAFGNPKGLTELALILAIIANINKLTGSNIIFQRETIDVLNLGPAQALYNTLNSNQKFLKYLPEDAQDAFGKFDKFSHLIPNRAIAFGYLDKNGNYNVPKLAPQGQPQPQANPAGQPQFGNNYGQQQQGQQNQRH